MTTPDEEPRVRLMDGATVITEFRRDADRGWYEHRQAAKAQEAFLDRRNRAAADTPYEELMGELNSGDRGHDDRGHTPQTHFVAMVGDQLLSDLAPRPEWKGLSPAEIPGYREVYELPGLTVRAEKLYPVLDAAHAVGLGTLPLSTLRTFVVEL